ncbi:unnamed protein product [Cylicocyclus nassatus]|uniref:Uncharacterized protein n=1 Tax=Cylicocyclus nassatus TaxID=53992 RepID=A0AA36GEX4_CYLNA|nr:unnamed protein product [Cylicocyclus nassatus]
MQICNAVIYHIKCVYASSNARRWRYAIQHAVPGPTSCWNKGFRRYHPNILNNDGHAGTDGWAEEEEQETGEREMSTQDRILYYAIHVQHFGLSERQSKKVADEMIDDGAVTGGDDDLFIADE